jgi:hypothetical protein
MDELKTTHLGNSRAIARSIGLSTDHPYIASSIANDSKGEKNIFASKKKVDEIIKYCEENNIQIVDSFYKSVNGVRIVKKNPR